MTMPNSAKVKVLVVDDSASVRQTLSDILSSDPEIEVMATAADPYLAARHLREGVPDVITLDIEMPRMDGITFLRKLMQQHPIPVVICSTLASEGSHSAMQALDIGAVDVIAKPAVATRQFLLESRIRICDAVKAAARARMARIRDRPPQAPPTLAAAPARFADKIICIGASTGGTDALRVVLSGLPENCPGALVVQHMPERFTTAFARMLDETCAVSVKEAEDGDRIERGRVLIAPGNFHMLVRRCGSGYRAEVRDGPLVTRHRPSVDVLFRSAAQNAGANAVGVILTGMGEDGADGLLRMRQTGAVTIAQDEASCVVFGMPREAIRRDAVTRIAPLDAIAAEILLGCAMPRQCQSMGAL